MELKELTIKVCNDRIYLNPQFSISIQQTNLPKEHLTFRSHLDIFWELEILEYESTNQCLKARVKDYYASSILKFDNQELHEHVDQLLFEKLDWRNLEPLLRSYQKSKFLSILFNLESPSISKNDHSSHKGLKSDLSFSSSTAWEIKPRMTTLSEDFFISFADAQFNLGHVTIKKHIKKIRRDVEFKIVNEHILAEFENIKSWFAKKLKTKKIKVSAVITLEDNEVIKTVATSMQIDQITPELIESIKHLRTIALKKEPRGAESNRLLFTFAEIFEQINSDDIEGNVFNQSEEDILNILMAESKIRNKKQLAYLADKKQTDNYKLRYTLNPHFGFLFLIEGTKKNHFVWELLNSHATYIWSIEKDNTEIELQFMRIESTINTVRVIGREDYKRLYKDKQTDSNLIFSSISHDDITSDIVDNFAKWKSKVNEQLV